MPPSIHAGVSPKLRELKIYTQRWSTKMMEDEEMMGNTVELEVIMIRIVNSETMDVTLNDEE